jgi:hypothetical protein
LYRPTLINMRAIPQLTSECGANAGGALRQHCPKVEEGIPSKDQNQRLAEIGRQLALASDKAKRDGAEVSERPTAPSGRDRSKRFYPSVVLLWREIICSQAAV